MTAVKMLEYQRQYICTKCKYVMMVMAEFEMKNIITPPKKCGNPEECKGTNIVSMGELNAEFCKDYQEIRMQETVSKLDVGSMPTSMWVTLEDDLVDSCKPGDNITVCGLVKRRQNHFYVGKKMEIELVIKANHVQVNNNNASALSLTPELKDMFQAFWKTYADMPLAARDIILKSICPQLFGLYIVKLATAVVLAGGSSLHNTSNTGVRVRAEPHLLLVGDPGTGKSQLLRFASKIIPRSVLTTGVGSTAAGLTVTAVMENGEWQLEGGALVMSDGGICCIDEFNTMKEHDRTSIHEAMEQQTISVAKASIVCKLSTRCSILAATNPKGNLDPSQSLNMNVALASPLLSRFDLILLLRDKLDEEWDSQLADYIFQSFENCNSSKLTENINWTIEILQAYFAVIKKIHPVLTEDSNKILSGYYQIQRRKNCRNKSRTTVRLLDSLVRLSQGHARLMYHEEVEILDAIIAVILVETAMETESSVFNLRFNLKNDFPQDPTSNYREVMEIVLKRLDLHDLLERELDRINNGSKRSNKSDPGTGKSNLLSEDVKSKFFRVQKASEEDIKQNGKTYEENAKQVNNKSISAENVKRDQNIELRLEHPGVKIDEKQINFEATKNIVQQESKTKRTKVSNANATTTKIHDIECQSKDIQIVKNNVSNVTKGDNINICDKENVECINLNAKRKKTKNNINPKKIKLKNEENELHHDLAALKCMPSVNDIFNMDDYDLNDPGLNFEENRNEKDSDDHENVSGLCSKINESSETKAIGETKNKTDTNGEQISKVLSQRIRTKNFLSKFKFIPKESGPSTVTTDDKSLQNNTNHNFVNMAGEDDQVNMQYKNSVSERLSNNQLVINDTDTNDLNDISFMNVVSSTQTEKPAMSEEKSNNSFESGNVDFDISLVSAKRSTNSENTTDDTLLTTNKPTTTKKFDFKKVCISDKLKPQSDVLHAPSSIFESQEDIDNLDLDL
ncbi:DNA helicase MCM9-like isoform X2 [Zophobas morio]